MSANGRPHCVMPAITIALPALEALRRHPVVLLAQPNIIFANVFAHALITPVQTITRARRRRPVVGVEHRPLRDHERERRERGATRSAGRRRRTSRRSWPRGRPPPARARGTGERFSGEVPVKSSVTSSPVLDQRQATRRARARARCRARRRSSRSGTCRPATRRSACARPPRPPAASAAARRRRSPAPRARHTSRMRVRTRSAAVARALRSVVIICGARMPKALNSSSMSVAQLVVLADLDRRQVQPFVEARGRRHRHPARLDRARLGRVVGRARPGDQLAVVEDRQHDHLVGVVDAAVERVVGEPDVAVLGCPGSRRSARGCT